jgi:hypothetical protein
MKGLELPVNILVIIIIAIIVLLALVALFLGGYTGVGVIDAAGAKAKACSVIINNGCNDAAADKHVPLTAKFCGREGTADSDQCTVSEICNRVGFAVMADCFKSCGCILNK